MVSDGFRWLLSGYRAVIEVQFVWVIRWLFGGYSIVI